MYLFMYLWIQLKKLKRISYSFEISLNNFINAFLLAGDKFMPEMHQDKLDLHIVLVDHLMKTKKEYKRKLKRISYSIKQISAIW